MCSGWGLEDREICNGRLSLYRFLRRKGRGKAEEEKVIYFKELLSDCLKKSNPIALIFLQRDITWKDKKTRLKIWAFVESIIRGVYCSSNTHTSQFQSFGGGLASFLLEVQLLNLNLTSFPQWRSRGVNPSLDLCWFQTLKLKKFFSRLWFVYLQQTLILFFPFSLKRKALERADEKAFFTLASSKQHCDELSANKSGSDELHFPLKI